MNVAKAQQGSDHENPALKGANKLPIVTQVQPIRVCIPLTAIRHIPHIAYQATGTDNDVPMAGRNEEILQNLASADGGKIAVSVGTRI